MTILAYIPVFHRQMKVGNRDVAPHISIDSSATPVENLPHESSLPHIGSKTNESFPSNWIYHVHNRTPLS